MDKKKDISLQNLAVRVINGEFGNGNLRKERLGYLYPFVQNIVNKKLLCTVEYPIDDALIEDLAKKAMDGVFGSNDELEKNLDYFYPKIQAKINEIKQKELKNKTIDEIACKVIDGKYGWGKSRREILGDLYPKVQYKVNEILGYKKIINLNNENPEQNMINNEINEVNKKEPKIDDIGKGLTIEELAKKVINGDYGNGEVRRNKLGVIYPIVQNRVNEILGYTHRYDINEDLINNLARRVIKGEYGNGEERKIRLGELYPFVQNRVNTILGVNKIYEEKPIPSYIKLNNFSL